MSKNKYTISIDFASKLGWSIFENNKLIKVGNFNFTNKEFTKLFKDAKFQEKLYDKVLFEQKEAKKLVQEIFSNIPQKQEIMIIIEFSDFGFKYAIERVSRLLTNTLLEINSFNNCANHNLKIETIIASQWRKIFKENNKSFDFSKYEVAAKNNRKKINWKVLAKDWVQEQIANKTFDIDSKLLNNNDITDSLIIAWTYINWMEKQ